MSAWGVFLQLIKRASVQLNSLFDRGDICVDGRRSKRSGSSVSKFDARGLAGRGMSQGCGLAPGVSRTDNTLDLLEEIQRDSRRVLSNCRI